MNTQQEQQRLIMYLIGWLDTADSTDFQTNLSESPHLQTAVPMVETFLGKLQWRWFQHQLQHELQQTIQEGEVTRLIQWAANTLEPHEISLAQSSLEENDLYRAFYQDLQELTVHLAEVDRQQLRRKLTGFLPSMPKRRSQQSQPSFQLAWRSKQNLLSNAPIALEVPAQFDLQIKLFTGGFKRQRREVYGQLTAKEMSAPLDTKMIKATVWLLPDGGGKWYEAKVEEDGRFAMGSVPPGSYTFEMAWTGGFLELFDIVIAPV